MLSPSSNPRLFLQGRGGTARTLTGTGVGARALTTNRQATLVTHAAIGSQVDQTLDRKLYFATQIAFDGEHINVLANTLQLGIGKVFYLLGVFDAGRFADFARARATDAKNSGETDFGVLMRRNVDASDT